MNTAKSEQNPGCLSKILGLLSTEKAPANAETKQMRPIAEAFKLRGSLLSSNELAFYDQLKVVVGQRFVILAKVRLADIFEVTHAPLYSTIKSDLNRIDSRHVDFLVCDPETLKPVFSVELDDRSHNRKDRVNSDNFKNEIFASMGLKLIRFHAEMEYSAEKIHDNIRSALEQKK